MTGMQLEKVPGTVSGTGTESSIGKDLDPWPRKDHSVDRLRSIQSIATRRIACQRGKDRHRNANLTVRELVNPNFDLCPSVLSVVQVRHPFVGFAQSLENGLHVVPPWQTRLVSHYMQPMNLVR